MVGLAERKMKPLDGWSIYSRCLIPYSFQYGAADLFYSWKQEHIIFTKGWLSTYSHFPSEVKNFLWFKLLKQGKKAGTVWLVLLQSRRPRTLGEEAASRGLGLRTLVAESAEESRQAIAVSRHVVTRPAAVHTLRAWLAAVVSIKTGGTNWRQTKVSRHRFSEDFSLLRTWEFSVLIPNQYFLTSENTVLWTAETMKPVGLSHV